MRTLRTFTAVAIALFCPSALRPQPAQTNRKLLQVYSNNDFQLTGVSVSKSGRVFVNFPRWSAEYLNAVVEVMPDGSAKPFPDEAWNRWNLDPKSAATHFVCVQSVVVDDTDALWVLDPAAPMLMSIVPNGPKLVKIDLKTNRVARVIPIGPEAAKTNTYLNDVRFDNRRNFAYITDSGLGGIVVVDLTTGKPHRALDGDASVMPDKSVKIVIDGKPVLGPTGETPSFHSDAIALSPDGEYLYYQPIAARSLYRVRTAALRDPNGKPAPERYAATFPVDGIWMDRNRNIYLSNLQEDGVSRLSPGGRIETLVTDRRLQWPDTFSEGPDGFIYVTASHINESPTFNKGKSTRTTPYAVFKFKP
jgi:sugar lactone lactonase YvrE